MGRERAEEKKKRKAKAAEAKSSVEAAPGAGGEPVHSLVFSAAALAAYRKAAKMPTAVAPKDLAEELTRVLPAGTKLDADVEQRRKHLRLCKKLLDVHEEDGPLAASHPAKQGVENAQRELDKVLK